MYMINILDICDSASVVKIIYYVKVFVTIITIAVPIILILSCMISAVKAVISGESDMVSKTLSSWIKKSVAALLIFMIPTIVFTIIDAVDGDANIKGCYESSTLNRVDTLEGTEKSSKEAQIAKWKQEQEAKKKLEDEKKRQMKEQKQKEKQKKKSTKNGGAPSTNNSYDYSTSTEANGNKTPAGKTVSIDVTNLGCPVTYDGMIKRTLVVHEAVANEVRNVLSKWCTGFVNQNQSLTNGRIETAGAYVNKAGYHGRGLAIDLYNNWKYTENGKTYTPYAGQGPDTFSRYNTFICEVCNGREDCNKNINYQLYYGYFKSINWCWGGNWTSTYFDPMHYEKTDGGCSVASGSRIKC